MKTRPVLETHRGHTMFGFPPDSAPLVVDCGAHKGEFAASVSASWKARCHSVEASPIMFAKMDLPDGSSAYNFAIAGEDGTLGFAISDNPEASHITDLDSMSADRIMEVPARNLANFLAEITDLPIDVLKLDIEGAEIAALAALDDRQVMTIKQITVEFHDFCGYVSPAAVDTTLERFRDLGFYIFNFAFQTRGDVLLVNPRFYPLNWLDRQWIRHVERIRRRLFRA